MLVKVNLKPGDLRVASSIFSNIASALLLAPFTTHDLTTLITSLIFAMIFISLAIKIERFLDSL